MTPLPYVVFAVYSLPKSGKYQKIRNLAKSKRRIRGETTPGAKRIGCVRNAGVTVAGGGGFADDRSKNLP